MNTDHVFLIERQLRAERMARVAAERAADTYAAMYCLPVAVARRLVPPLPLWVLAELRDALDRKGRRLSAAYDAANPATLAGKLDRMTLWYHLIFNDRNRRCIVAHMTTRRPDHA